jgi:hypothetical protein
MTASALGGPGYPSFSDYYLGSWTQSKCDAKFRNRSPSHLTWWFGAEDDIFIAISSGKWCSWASGCARGSHISLVWAMLQAVLFAHHGLESAVLKSSSQVCGFIQDELFKTCSTVLTIMGNMWFCYIYICFISSLCTTIGLPAPPSQLASTCVLIASSPLIICPDWFRPILQPITIAHIHI